MRDYGVEGLLGTAGTVYGKASEQEQAQWLAGAERRSQWFKNSEFQEWRNSGVQGGGAQVSLSTWNVGTSKRIGV